MSNPFGFLKLNKAPATVGTVPAVKYKTKIYDGMRDFVHGRGGQEIIEYFIPSLGIGFNDTGAFKMDAPHNKYYNHPMEEKPSESPLTNVLLSQNLVDLVKSRGFKCSAETRK